MQPGCSFWKIICFNDDPVIVCFKFCAIGCQILIVLGFIPTWTIDKSNYVISMREINLFNFTLVNWPINEQSLTSNRIWIKNALTSQIGQMQIKRWKNVKYFETRYSRPIWEMIHDVSYIYCLNGTRNQWKNRNLCHQSYTQSGSYVRALDHLLKFVNRSRFTFHTNWFMTISISTMESQKWFRIQKHKTSAPAYWSHHEIKETFFFLFLY